MKFQMLGHSAKQIKGRYEKKCHFLLNVYTHVDGKGGKIAEELENELLVKIPEARLSMRSISKTCVSITLNEF